MKEVLSTLSEDPIPTRHSLLSRLQNWEDHESWRDFFDTYWRLIYSVARRSGLTDDEAQEVVQETVISVARNIQKFKRDRKLGSFKGWLRNLTHWRIVDQLRKRKTVLQADLSTAGQNFPTPEDVPEPPSETIASDWEIEWQQNLLKAALDRIRRNVKEEQFQLFDLYAIRHWPVRRITQTLDVSAARVYLAKHRITRLLQKEVRRLQKGWDCA